LVGVEYQKKEISMNYYDEEYEDLYDNETLTNEYEDDVYENDIYDDGLEAWENYYHNIADEIVDD
jgi:hypothetical protein